MASKRVIVAGGTGFIGGALLQKLSRQGYKALAVTRAWEPHAPNQIPWHVLEQNGLPTNTHAVINLAGTSIGNPCRHWDKEFMDEVRNSRINTTTKLAKMVETAKAKVWISTSGVSYYGTDKPLEYTEESGAGAPNDYFVKLAVDWEKAAQVPKDAKVRQAVLRLGMVLGRTGGAVKNSLWPTFFGVGGALGHGGQYMPWIHVDDVCNMFVSVLANDALSGVFNAVAPEQSTNRDFVRAFARAMYPPRPSFCSVPEKAVKLMFGEERANLLLGSQKVSCKKIQDTGFQFEYPDLKEAAKEFARVQLHDDEIIRETSVVGKWFTLHSQEQIRA